MMSCDKKSFFRNTYSLGLKENLKFKIHVKKCLTENKNKNCRKTIF